MAKLRQPPGWLVKPGFLSRLTAGLLIAAVGYEYLVVGSSCVAGRYLIVGVAAVCSFPLSVSTLCAFFALQYAYFFVTIGMAACDSPPFTLLGATVGGLAITTIGAVYFRRNVPLTDSLGRLLGGEVGEEALAQLRQAHTQRMREEVDRGRRELLRFCYFTRVIQEIAFVVGDRIKHILFPSASTNKSDDG